MGCGVERSVSKGRDIRAFNLASWGTDRYSHDGEESHRCEGQLFAEIRHCSAADESARQLAPEHQLYGFCLQNAGDSGLAFRMLLRLAR